MRGDCLDIIGNVFLIFLERAAALTDLTRARNPSKVLWLDIHEHAFLDLKKALQTPPVLRPPNWNEEFILQIDASDRGLGAILCMPER